MVETRGVNPDEVRQNLNETVGHLEGDKTKIDTDAERAIARELATTAETADVGMEELRQADIIAVAEKADQEESAEKIEAAKEEAIEAASAIEGEEANQPETAEADNSSLQEMEPEKPSSTEVSKKELAVKKGIAGVAGVFTIAAGVILDPLRKLYLSVESLFKNDFQFLQGGFSKDVKNIKDIWFPPKKEDKKDK